MARVEDLRIRAQVDGVQRAQADMNKLSGSVGGIVKSLGLAAAATMAFRKGIRLASEAMEVYEQQIISVRRLESTLAATGRAAEISSEELQKLASSLQSVSNFGDEDILRESTVSLLRFGSISRDIFPRVQKLAIDMAEDMGGLSAASRNLGMALDDPIMGMTRLRRANVTFTKEQQETIKQLVATGREAEAQTIILDALESRYSGLATASISAKKQMQNAWGDYLEVMGSSLAIVDGVRRGITASLIDVAGQIDITSQAARLAALDSQESWGKAVIYASNSIKLLVTGMGGFYTGLYATVKNYLLIIGQTVSLTIDTLKQATITALNATSYLIITSWEKMFGLIAKISKRITGNDLGIPDIFDDLRDRFSIANTDLAGSFDDMRKTLSQAGEDFKAWTNNIRAMPANMRHSIEEQTKILTDGIDAQRAAILRGSTGMEMEGFSMEGIDLGGQIQQMEDYYATIMSLNRNATQRIIDSHNEMRANLAEYVESLDVDEIEKKRMLSEGLIEIKKSETAALQAEAEKIANAEKQAAERALDIRVNALRGISGYENTYYRLRLEQIENETEKLREAGLEQLEIIAWQNAERAKLQEEMNLNSVTEEAASSMLALEDIAQSAMRSIEYSFSSAMSNIFTGTMSGTKALADMWKSMAGSIIAEISRIIAKLVVLSFWQLITGTAPAAAAAGAASGVSGGIIGAPGTLSAGNGFNSYSAPISMNESSLSYVSNRIDRLATAIENNPPQIYTQLIEGVPLHRAVERARIVTNAL